MLAACPAWALIALPVAGIAKLGHNYDLTPADGP
jgi:hypothetical protein